MVSRFRFLRASGAAASLTAAGALIACERSPEQTAAAPTAPPTIAIAKAKDLQAGTPVPFAYPDSQSPALLLRLRNPVPDGAGPDRTIVAYSRLCVHRGCPVNYEPQREILLCPCHHSVYDAEKAGQIVIGHATTRLPRIRLAYDAASDELTATGVDGLIYGRSDDSPLASAGSPVPAAT